MSGIQETLKKLDFEPSGAEIYLILAKNGEMTVPQILEKTQLSRATVYEILSTLIASDLAEYRKEGRIAYYAPTHPNQLFDLLEKKKRAMSLLEGELGGAVKNLIGSYHLSMRKPGVRFFEGVEGLKEIYLDTIAQSGKIYSVISPSAIDSELSQWVKQTFIPLRVQKGIESVFLADDSQSPQEFPAEDTKFLTKTVIVPRDKFPFDVEMKMYGGDRVALISPSSDELIGMIIQSKSIYTTMKSLFMLAKTFQK